MASAVVGVTVSVPRPSCSLSLPCSPSGPGGWEHQGLGATGLQQLRRPVEVAWLCQHGRQGGKGFPLHRGPSPLVGVVPSTRQLWG